VIAARSREGSLDPAPQPAWLRYCAGGVEVELIAGEDGVSPGQACVFYDAQEGRHVCSAAASSRARGGRRGGPAREAMAGRAAAPDDLIGARGQ